MIVAPNTDLGFRLSAGTSASSSRGLAQADHVEIVFAAPVTYVRCRSAGSRPAAARKDDFLPIGGRAAGQRQGFGWGGWRPPQQAYRDRDQHAKHEADHMRE